MTEVKLIAPLIVLHLIAMIAFVGLLSFALFDGDPRARRHDDGGRDGPPRWPEPVPAPPRGPPLANAAPARVRLRGPGRLAEIQRPARSRRPHQPHRVPARERQQARSTS